MTTKQTIDGVPRELIERVTKPLTIRDDLTDRIKARDELRALLDASESQYDGMTPAQAQMVSQGVDELIFGELVAQPQGDTITFPRELSDELAELIAGKARVCGGGAFEIWEAICEQFGKSEQPAPVAVVMPERRVIDEGASDADQHTDYGWNACLDELKRLNTKEQHHGKP